MTILSKIHQILARHDQPLERWSALMNDMRDALEKISSRICQTCEGDGFVDNPDVRYSEDYAAGRRTGQYSTNDPEEIDCPHCGGVGFLPLPRAQPERYPQVDREDGLPF